METNQVGNEQSPKPFNLKEYLDKIDSQAGLYHMDAFGNKGEAEKILNLSRDEIHKLTPAEATENAIILSQFAVFIQRLANKESATIVWADEKIIKIVGKKINQYKAFHYEDKKQLAILDDSAAVDFNTTKKKAELHLANFSYLSGRIQNMCDALIEHAKVSGRRKDYA